MISLCKQKCPRDEKSKCMDSNRETKSRSDAQTTDCIRVSPGPCRGTSAPAPPSVGSLASNYIPHCRTSTADPRESKLHHRQRTGQPPEITAYYILSNPIYSRPKLVRLAAPARRSSRLVGARVGRSLPPGDGARMKDAITWVSGWCGA